MRRQSVVVHDILKLGAVGNLIGLDGPFPRTFKTLGDGFRNLTNRVAGAVVWDGSVDTGWSLACAEPCFGLVFGGGKAIDVCSQCANNLLRAVTDNLKAFTLNVISSFDLETFNRLKSWMNSLKRSSTLITVSGEKERVRFFNDQRQLVSDMTNTV